MPLPSLWDDSDIRAHTLMTEKVHAHGALAGAELWYGGARTGNMMTREVAMDLASMPNTAGHPFQTRAMDKTDIRNLRPLAPQGGAEGAGRGALTLSMYMRPTPIFCLIFLAPKLTPVQTNTVAV